MKPLTAAGPAHRLQLMSQTYQSLCDDGSGRRPGEDFDLTRRVDQHIPVQVSHDGKRLSVL